MRLNRVVAVAAMLLSFESVATSQSPTTFWGDPSRGLPLGIARGEESDLQTPELRVSFANVGPNDFVLNLGVMLANGRVMEPLALSLIVTGEDGRSQTFRWGGPHFVGGRLDDFLVSLRVGATYTMAVRIDGFHRETPDQLKLRLPPGKYRVAASFEGRGAQALNLDTPGVGLLNFWVGSIMSGILEFEVEP